VKLQLTNKFLHRVRIHGGEFDSSARAMNRAGEKDTLITYERALTAQADLRKFRGSTTERKHMSTKTTFKRLALVTVAALGLGVLSIAPSSAVVNADTLTLSATSAAQTTAETATATSATATLAFLGGVVSDSMTVTASLVSGPATSTALPYLQLVETVSASIDNASLASSDALLTHVAPNEKSTVYNSTSGAAQVSAKYKVYLAKTNETTAPTVPGTYVVKLTPAIGSTGSLNAAAQTITITVTTAPSLDTVASSATVYLNAGETNTATVAKADAAFVTGSKTASNTAAVANLSVALLNAAAASVTAESFTATITGPGTLGIGRYASGGTDFNDTFTAIGRAITVKNGDNVLVFPDGTSGVGTVTISSAAGKTLATKSVTFFGDATKIVTTVKKTVIGGTTSVADVLSIVVTDAAGTSVSNLTTVNVVSSDVTKIAGAYTSATATYSTTTGAYLVPVTPVAAGSANITVTTKASATATTGVDAAAVAVRVGSKTPASVTVTTDKSSYAPGEKAVITVALADATALDLVSAETYTAIFATGGITSSYTLGSGSATISGTDIISYAAGGKTFEVFMPVTEGDVKFSWTTGSTASASGTGLATANQAKEGSVTVSVSSAGTAAALDAANEATDAANAATDAALAAADAADAATAAAEDASAAVAALAKSVNTALNNLKKQITALTKLVNKLLK